ncbi:hypothetical protein [Streptomyces canus]|uniref:hypothetical protein n=1 Tax=Streptomyces canus TaxID=58343 RepID=UPI002DD86FD6|nr:hypothetical protein [Streptomyces canus]WSD89132.1 hypothetical protein OG925_34795 [Streptomyces canus]
MEHTTAEYKRWRPLQRFTERREAYTETHLAIAGLVSDRSARRATRPQAQHRTRARPTGRLLITQQPIRQDSAPRTQS